MARVVNTLETTTEILLTQGGDTRILCDEHGFNKYGCRPSGRPATVSIGSCTASSTSSESLIAARQIHQLMLDSNGIPAGTRAISDSIRGALRSVLELPYQHEIILSPSGTDGELLALAFVASVTNRPIVNVLVGPREVGSGSGWAAEGCYYDSLTPAGYEVNIGDPIDQAVSSRVTVERVPVRDCEGNPRVSFEIDDEVTEKVTSAVSQGSTVLLHVVYHSKTGITAPSLGLVHRLRQNLKDDIHVVVDAAQGRISPISLSSLLEQGCMAIWTGSKFFGGPAFAGSLLVPPRYRSIKRQLPLSAALNQFYCRTDFPHSWSVATSGFGRWDNYGSLARWGAAIAEMRRFASVDPDTRTAIFRAFECDVVESFRSSHTISLYSTNAKQYVNSWTDDPLDTSTSVFTFTVKTPTGKLLDRAQLCLLHKALSDESSGSASWHLGQPVQLADNKWGLRIALGAPLVSDLATKPIFGESLADKLGWFAMQVENLRANIEEFAKSQDNVYAPASA